MEFQLGERVRLQDPGGPDYLTGILVSANEVPDFLVPGELVCVFGLTVDNVDPRDLDGHPYPVYDGDISRGFVTPINDHPDAAVRRVMEKVPNNTGASVDTAIYELLNDRLSLPLGENTSEAEIRALALSVLLELRDSAEALVRTLQTEDEG